MASRMSAGVTIPSKWPYSSWTSAMGTSAWRSTLSASRASTVSGMTGAVPHMGSDVERLAPEECGDKLPDLHDADHVVGRALAHRKSRVNRRDQALA